MSNFGSKSTCPEWWNNARTAEQHEKLEGQVEFYGSNWDNTPPWGFPENQKGKPSSQVEFSSSKWPGDPNLWPGYEVEESLANYNARKLMCMKNRAKFEKVSDAMVRELSPADANMQMNIVREKDMAATQKFDSEGWNNYVDRQHAGKVNKRIATEASLKIANKRKR
jgi:hypothetical protein